MGLALLGLVSGLAALYFGGGLLVAGALALARRLGLSPMLIGLTVVGFGTSAPELLVSVDAALRGLAAIAIGNVVGSNTANILLIMGLGALIAPMTPDRTTLRRDLAVMLAAAAALVPIFAAGVMPRPVGAVLLAALVLYLVLGYRAAAGEPSGAVVGVQGLASGRALGAGSALVRIAAGLVLLVVGARLLVDGSVTLARGVGVSEAFIGLSVVAVGTSLPELATTLAAAVRREADIALGNVLGSNIFNVLGILGITAVIAPIQVAPRFLWLDLPVMLAASAVLAGLLLLRGGVGRRAALAMLAGYGVYLWLAQF